MAKAKNVLKTVSDAELLSYMINVTPELKGQIDLPVQGQSLAPIGQIIINNQRYRNAFLNTVNLIGITVLKRNAWDDPWREFTDRGDLTYGQHIREIINDLCDVYQYNDKENNDIRFTKTVVPNVLQYMHELDFQVFYETTTSDEQMAMAFEGDGALYDYVADAVGMLWESWKYDRYIINKYMLCRRIVDGTLTSVEIDNYASLTPRQRVSAMKNISNKISFRSPDYNPAGIRKASSFEDQIFIINTDFEASMSTEVLATSYFRNDAEFKAYSALIDGFNTHDTERLAKVLGNQYVPFTSDELIELAKVPAVIISREWFMNYRWAMDSRADTADGRNTEFFNPTTLKNNHFLHIWGVFSTSPFECAAVFTADVTPAVSTVTVSPSSATLSEGGSLKFSATVATTGFANKAVIWSTNEDTLKINEDGSISIPLEYTGASAVTVTAKSVFDTTKTGTATLNIV